MKRTMRSAMVSLVAVAMLALGALPAAAAPPSWAGPPEVETSQLAGDDEAPFFVCGDDVLMFSGGTATFRFKSLPQDRYIGIITLQGAEATAAGSGEVFQVHGSGMFKGAGEDSGTLRLNLTFVGAAGTIERVNHLSSEDSESLSIVERGTCEVVFPEA